MSDKRYEANIIRATAVEPSNNIETTSAPGVWSLDEVVELQKKEKWPTVGNVITNVENVFSTFLYEGNGSAQNINNGINLGNNIAGSVDFDGAGDSLESSSHSFAYGTGDFTVEFWAYFDGVSGTQNIFDNRSGGSTGFLIGINSSSTMRFYWDSADRIADSATVSTGQWYHIAVARSSGTTKMFKNGTQIGSDYSDSNNYTSSVLEIGQRSISDGLEFDGKLSNVRVVLGTALYTANFDAPTAPLTAISGTELLICTANNFLDEGPNKIAFTVKGDPQVLSSSPFTGNTGEGGLVWIKQRDASRDHGLFDTARGTGKYLVANDSAVEATSSTMLNGFNSNGFLLSGGGAIVNNNTNEYVSWTFRKAEKFFDVVTYSGQNTDLALSHNLGVAPGMVLVKRTDTTGDWYVYHRSLNLSENLVLNSAGDVGSNNFWTSSAPSSTVFNIDGNRAAINQSGGTYVAYLFAHNNNDGGFGPDQNADIVKCGIYTGNGSTDGVLQDLGFEPQWIIVKNTDLSTEPWVMLDNMRGVGGAASNDPRLLANSYSAESNGAIMKLDSTGFTPISADDKINGSGHTYIYMAIRRGPMATPTAATNVFHVNQQNNADTFSVGFPTDLAIVAKTGGSSSNSVVGARIAGDNDNFLVTSGTDAEATSSNIFKFDLQTSFKQAFSTSAENVSWLWRRAPGFCDIITYEGSGSARDLSHNLGIVPEMYWIKARDETRGWIVYANIGGTYKELSLNGTGAASTASSIGGDPTASVIKLGTTYNENRSGYSYISMLFATVAGVSKFGTYTGTGSSDINVDCGFSSGARFVLIKRTDASGSWWVADTVRGIASGNDSLIEWNGTGAEVTNYNMVKPLSSGFIVNGGTGKDNSWNDSGGSYIFYAIAT